MTETQKRVMREAEEFFTRMVRSVTPREAAERVGVECSKTVRRARRREREKIEEGEEGEEEEEEETIMRGDFIDLIGLMVVCKVGEGRDGRRGTGSAGGKVEGLKGGEREELGRERNTAGRSES